jgi:hypothetical protein
MANQTTLPSPGQGTSGTASRLEYNPNIFGALKALDDLFKAEALEKSKEPSPPENLPGMSAAMEKVINFRHSQLVKENSSHRAARASAKLKSVGQDMETRRWLGNISYEGGTNSTDGNPGALVVRSPPQNGGGTGGVTLRNPL